VRWIAVLTLAACAAATLAGGCEGREPQLRAGDEEDEPVTGAYVLELDLTRGVPEIATGGLLGPTLPHGHADLVRALRERSADEDLEGVFVRLGTADLPLARAGEIGRQLREMKERGAVVTCHADELGNGALLLFAQGCSSVWLSPAGGVEAISPAVQLVFAKSLLEKLDVEASFEQVGKYKGAEEPYTRDEPSPEARESVESTVKALRDAWLAGIVDGRGEAVEHAAEDGPWAAEEARSIGLVDEVGFVDDAKRAAKEKAGAVRTVLGFGRGPGDAAGGLDDFLRALGGGDATALPHVAVVRAIGAITMRGGGGLFGGGQGIAEDDLGPTLRELAKDDAVKAVVLRIDSPGGSALASDLLWHELMKLRAKKPLIVSVGGMAASGGYFLACAGQPIFAEPTSIVGSIGVVGGKLSFKKALAGIGVHVATITGAPDPEAAARAAYLSPLEPWDEATRAKVRASMVAVYDLFLARAAEGRGLPTATIAESAEGRIFGGRAAQERKLVDRMGGLDDAIRYALEASELGDDGRVSIVGGPSSLFELLDGEASARAAEGVRRELVVPALLPEAPRAELTAFLDAVAPLASGERALAAMPFALVVP
jgi:protease-4